MCVCVCIHTYMRVDVCVCVQCCIYLGSVPLLWVSGGGVERAEDLHRLVVGGLGCQDSLKALGRLGVECEDGECGVRASCEGGVRVV